MLKELHKIILQTYCTNQFHQAVDSIVAINYGFLILF